MLILASSVVDRDALKDVVLYAFAGSLVLVTLFTAGVLGLETEGTQGGATRARQAAGVAALLACAVLLVFGVTVLLDK